MQIFSSASSAGQIRTLPVLSTLRRPQQEAVDGVRVQDRPLRPFLVLSSSTTLLKSRTPRRRPFTSSKGPSSETTRVSTHPSVRWESISLIWILCSALRLRTRICQPGQSGDTAPHCRGHGSRASPGVTSASRVQVRIGNGGWVDKGSIRGRCSKDLGPSTGKVLTLVLAPQLPDPCSSDP